MSIANYVYIQHFMFCNSDVKSPVFFSQNNSGDFHLFLAPPWLFFTFNNLLFTYNIYVYRWFWFGSILVSICILHISILQLKILTFLFIAWAIIFEHNLWIRPFGGLFYMGRWILRIWYDNLENEMLHTFSIWSSLQIAGFSILANILMEIVKSFGPQKGTSTNKSLEHTIT